MIDHMISDTERIIAESEAKAKAKKEMASHGAIQAERGPVVHDNVGGGANDTIDGGEGGEVEDVVAGNQTTKEKGAGAAGGNETTELEGAGTAGHGLKKTGEDVDSNEYVDSNEDVDLNETVSSAEQGTLEGAGGGEGADGGEGVGGGEAVGGEEGAVGGEKSGDSSSANGETFHLFHLTHSWISISNTPLSSYNLSVTILHKPKVKVNVDLNFCYMQYNAI